MSKVKVLGVSVSPRKGRNTEKLLSLARAYGVEPRAGFELEVKKPLHTCARAETIKKIKFTPTHISY